MNGNLTTDDLTCELLDIPNVVGTSVDTNSWVKMDAMPQDDIDDFDEDDFDDDFDDDFEDEDDFDFEEDDEFDTDSGKPADDFDKA